MSNDDRRSGSGRCWGRVDGLLMAAWGLAAVLTRLPLVARAEGMLDHDQSVVGLMALDIAEGRRFPLFFDGQRYMGGLEPYVAAGFVRLFGHSPTVVALSPLLFFGLFVAGQFGIWRAWRGRARGNLAALLTVICGPMLVVWGVVPRGGYVVALAWALPTLWAYRELARRNRPPVGPAVQFGWGLLLALGYFLNPFSLILYATLALDWTFGLHGPEVREGRGAGWRWPDGPAAPFGWLMIGLTWLLLMTFCLHVDPRSIATSGGPYVPFGGTVRGRFAEVAGGAGAVALLILGAWWTGAPFRLFRLLTRCPWGGLGALVALSPFVIQGLLIKLGAWQEVPSLPIWLGAPWKAGENFMVGLASLGALVGSDPSPVETVLIGQGVEPPSSRWPALAAALLGTSSLVVAIVAVLLARVVWEGRSKWVRFASLRDGKPGSPERLTLLYLGATASLYLLQGTSPNASSSRYLVAAWVVLPGLLAGGLLGLPRGWRVAASAGLLVPWAAVIVSVWADIDRPSPTRRLATELEHRGVNGIVAPTPVALIVANLSSGRVGALEFRPPWRRMGHRYLDRFPKDGPIVCVTDRRFPSFLTDASVEATERNLARHLDSLAEGHPDKVRILWSMDDYDVWEADLPLDSVLAEGPTRLIEHRPEALAGVGGSRLSK